MPVSVRQVAERAGVSVATVSYVLNEKGNITPETRQHVQNVISQMGYIRKRKVGSDLAFFTVESSGFGHNWICQAAAEHGFTTHPVICSDGLDQPPAFDLNVNIAGAIISGGQWKRPFLETVSKHYPTVLLGSYLPTTRSDAVWVDSASGIYLAVDYLVRRGHMCIGLINGPSKSATSAEKLTGFERALRDANLQGMGVTAVATNFSQVAGLKAVRKLLEGTPRPTAIIAGETAYGIATLEACQEAGLKVPDDLSLVTFRDRAELKVCHPPISAICIPELSICREAMSRLVMRIGNPISAGQRVLLQPEMIERGSVAAPRM